MKHRVDEGIYVFYGSMNPQLAERTGFSDEDAEAIKRFFQGYLRTMHRRQGRKAAWKCSR